jgi:hypothetical protein
MMVRSAIADVHRNVDDAIRLVYGLPGRDWKRASVHVDFPELELGSSSVRVVAIEGWAMSAALAGPCYAKLCEQVLSLPCYPTEESQLWVCHRASGSWTR